MHLHSIKLNTIIALPLFFLLGCGSSGSSEDKTVNTLTPENTQTTPNTAPSSHSTSNDGLVKAFPSAEGFGAYATGGRGGQTLKVTNLQTSGPGSLQYALNQSGAKIIIFAASGVIEGDVNIPVGNVTIAGQTAPGAGITIHGRLICDYDARPDNIIIRFLRVRADHSTNSGVNGDQYDGLQCSRSSNLIFDHLSVSGGVDENFDIYEATNVSLQWSTITRSNQVGHSEGNHNYGLINGPNGNSISIHHNLFAHNRKRNPALANGPAEIVNNVIYNTRIGFSHENPSTGNFNVIGNFFKQGPNDSLIPFFFDDENTGSGAPSLNYFLSDNYVDDPGDLQASVNNPWSTPILHSSFANIDYGWDSSIARTTNMHSFNSVAITTSNSQTAYTDVLKYVGTFPRDSMTNDDIQEVTNRTGSWGTRIPNNLLQGLSVSEAPTDTDNDGLPDAWEANNGLLVNVADQNTIMTSGYTAIEEYINQLAMSLLP